MFVFVMISFIFGLLGYIFGRGQAALFYEREVMGLLESLKTKREVIRILRRRVERLELGEGWKLGDCDCDDEDEADWWKSGGEAPF